MSLIDETKEEQEYRKTRLKYLRSLLRQHMKNWLSLRALERKTWVNNVLIWRMLKPNKMKISTIEQYIRIFK